MGEVYRAEDLTLRRDVALEVLLRELVDDPDRVRGFELEARAIAALRHSHVVTIYSVEEAEGSRFLPMELVEGQSLEALILARLLIFSA